MGIIDWFRVTPPKDKLFSVYISNFLKEDQYIFECYMDEIIASGCVDGLKLDYELFAKHWRAIQIQIFFFQMPRFFEDKKYIEYSKSLIEAVNNFDKDIWQLVKFKYGDAQTSGGIQGMIEALNQKPFKGKLGDKVISKLVTGLKAVEIEMIDAIKKLN